MYEEHGFSGSEPTVRRWVREFKASPGEGRAAAVIPLDAEVAREAKRYGAAVIALTIDEEGMAMTAEKKVAIPHRIFHLATKKYGIRPVEIIFDALTLPISTGQTCTGRRGWRRWRRSSASNRNYPR